MASKYELTQGTKLSVSKTAATEANSASTVWLDLGGTVTEFSYNGGQKSDIEVTTLASTEQEMTNGLPAPGEITFSGNWVIDDEAQKSLRAAYDNDATHAFKIIFPSGKGYAFMAEVRQNSFSVAKAGVVTASYTLRMKGKLVEI
ncbi:hypothetical protein GCM10023211_02330 [Orbus sasakiae]|uniref:Phage tail protein n=1 Tax=Orbus sasakiae TaxID=1078475 RepID=A0ABP9MYB2_9GAMM